MIYLIVFAAGGYFFALARENYTFRPFDYLNGAKSIQIVRRRSLLVEPLEARQVLAAASVTINEIM